MSYKNFEFKFEYVLNSKFIKLIPLNMPLNFGKRKAKFQGTIILNQKFQPMVLLKIKK